MTHTKISIFLRDCIVQLPVGIYEDEQKAPQTVAVSIEAETTLTSPFDRDEKDIGRTVSYERLYHFVREDLPRMGHIYLLESLAEIIVDFCFRDTRIRSVTVKLEKRDILPGAVPGIIMTRTRAS